MVSTKTVETVDTFEATVTSTGADVTVTKEIPAGEEWYLMQLQVINVTDLIYSFGGVRARDGVYTSLLYSEVGDANDDIIRSWGYPGWGPCVFGSKIVLHLNTTKAGDSLKWQITVLRRAVRE